MQYRFVTGLEGHVTNAIKENFNGQNIRIPIGGKFRIRWDYDPTGKGVHVNAEFGNAQRVFQTKIAFVPSNTPLVDPPNNRNPLLFQQVVNKYSNALQYNTQPNTVDSAYTPMQRTVEKTQVALNTMASDLARIWINEGC
jgi:hypothetical protein